MQYMRDLLEMLYDGDIFRRFVSKKNLATYIRSLDEHHDWDHRLQTRTRLLEGGALQYDRCLYPIETVNKAIAAAPERGDSVEQNDGYAPAEPDTYWKYLW